MTDKQQRFFEFMLNEHNLILTSEQMNEIAFEAKIFHSPDEIEEQPQAKEPRPFKIGDQVYCRHEDATGVIEEIRADYSHALLVRFRGGNARSYTLDGFRAYSGDLEPTLLHI